jgi:tetratricopeptide (TPR) repeat protein
MTTQRSEVLIHEMELALKRVEARLENSEAKQNTTALRFDDLYKALHERLNAKDDTLTRLKEQSEWTLRQNDVLLKQIGLRWNLLTGLTSFLGLAFALVFVYQTWRVEQINDAKKTLEASAAAVNESSKQLAQNSKAYSDILSILAHADTLMTESNREFLRAEYAVAAKRGSDATEALTSALQITGDNFAELKKLTLRYVSTTCSLTASTLAVPEKVTAVSEKVTRDPDPALSPKALRTAVGDALFTAYDLHARAAFFSTPRGDLRADGTMLLALNESQWEGYHWIGLAAEEAGFLPEATECFRRSVDKNPVGNKDYLNLAELSFIHSDFPAAVKYSDQYLHPLNHRFKSSLDVVAQFYFSAAGFLVHDAEAQREMPPELFEGKVGGLPDFTLEGTFSPVDLNKYLSGQAFSEKVPDDQRKQVQKLADCLIKRICKG